MKELPVESLDGTKGCVASSMAGGGDSDFYAGADELIRQDRSQNAGDGVGEVPVQQILELGMSEDGVQFRRQPESITREEWDTVIGRALGR